MQSLAWVLSFGLLASAAPLVGVVTRDVPTFAYNGDVPFSVDAATLAAAMHCPNGVPTAAKPPVLLVHGTAASGNDTWMWTYVPALLADGYTACYLELRMIVCPRVQMLADTSQPTELVLICKYPQNMLHMVSITSRICREDSSLL